MIEQKKLIGIVSWSPNHQACYVRVSIPNWKTDVPLSVKATFSDFNWRDIKKGDVVEVERSDPRDARHFRVLRLLKVVEPKEPVPVNFTIAVPNAETFKKEKTVEKVKFYLNSKYFKNPELPGVLARVFNVTHEEYRVTFNQGTGFTFICTTDQFARFLIDRNLNGIKNGFMDLNAKLIRSDPEPDAYATLAKKVGITREQTKLVSLALGYSEGAFRSRVGYGARNWELGSVRMHRVLDVSER